MTTTIYVDDCKNVLPTLPANSVQCVITSPPYWGLRDYGVAGQVWGGDAECEHEWGESERQHPGYRSDYGAPKQQSNRGTVIETETITDAFCQRCSAWRGSLGLEPTPELYVEHLVQIFAELKRVLRDDGTCWLNLGDSYAGGNYRGGGVENASAKQASNTGTVEFMQRQAPPIPSGLKPKDLCGIPWRVAFALQADGWWLRSDIIWHKSNCMPESVTDRPTKAHEYIFLLTKSARYFYDAEAIREDFADDRMGNPGAYKWSYAHDPKTGKGIRGSGGPSEKLQAEGWNAGGERSGRNRRTVWTIPTQPYSGAHFATFAPALVEPMIKAGTSERGCCTACGSPWERVVESTQSSWSERKAAGHRSNRGGNIKIQKAHGATHDFDNRAGGFGEPRKSRTTGWCPTCDCTDDLVRGSGPPYPHRPIPCTVLDPFAGAGTVGLVADRLQRDAILIELSPEYAEMARRRIEGEAPMFTSVDMRGEA